MMRKYIMVKAGDAKKLKRTKIVEKFINVAGIGVNMQ